MLNGYLSFIGAILLIIVGVGTMLVTGGQVALNLLTGESVDWNAAGVSLKTAFAAISAGVVAFGLARKADKNTEAVKENTAVTTQALRKL